MRLSRYFLPILRETPKEAEVVSHRLMLRAGLIRQEAAGIYAWLPLGFRVLKKIEPLEIELVEQPVPRHDLDGLRWVRDRVGIPVFADESVHDPTDVAHLAGRVDGVNLKLMKAGGLRRMLHSLITAKAHGMKVMLGSMVESSLALTAAAQLAPLADHLDLDGHWLLRRDPFRGAPGERGRIELQDTPGLGIEPAGAA